MPPSIPIPSLTAAAGHDEGPNIPKPSQRLRKSTKKAGSGKRLLKPRRNKKAEVSAGGSAAEEALQATADTVGSDQNPLGQYNNTSSIMMQNSMANGMMYGSPYCGGVSPLGMGGPFSGIYQVLFGVQNVIFSLGQAIQILGMNQQALQQAFDSLTAMIDHAVATFHDLRALEATESEKESEEQKTRRRRLKTIRWALLMGGSWLVYKLIRRLTQKRRRLAHREIQAFGRLGPQPYGGYSFGHGSQQINPSYSGYNFGGAQGLFGGGSYGSGNGYF